MRKKKSIAVVVAALSGALLAAGCSSGSSGGSSNSGTDWTKVTSVAQGGGMKALIAAAKKEGELNVITLPCQLGQLRQHHEGLHRQVRHQDQRREP